MINTIRPQTEAFVGMWRNASERERSMLGDMHQHYERGIRQLRKEGTEPQNIAYTLHTLIDESVVKTLTTTENGRKVQCSRGCSACCRLHISITAEEAFLLVGWCADQGIEIDWDKIERQAPRNLAAFNNEPEEERRCVFLNAETGECKVYEHRPAACRKYLVASAPERCDTVRYPGGEVAIVVPLEAEVLTSAMLGVLKSGPFARMLLAQRDKPHD